MKNKLPVRVWVSIGILVTLFLVLLFYIPVIGVVLGVFVSVLYSLFTIVKYFVEMMYYYE